MATELPLPYLHNSLLVQDWPSTKMYRDRAEGGAGGALAPQLLCKNKNKLNKK